MTWEFKVLHFNSNQLRVITYVSVSPKFLRTQILNVIFQRHKTFFTAKMYFLMIFVSSNDFFSF